MLTKTIQKPFNPCASGRRIVSRSLITNAALVAAFLFTAAFCSWSAAALAAPLWTFLLLTCWLERRHAGRCTAEAYAQRTRLAPYLSALPTLIFQLRESAHHLEAAVLQACDGFDAIRAHARGADREQNLEREIRRVIVALQFEDIVNQRIGQAIETLHRLDTDLSACVDFRRTASTDDRLTNAVDRKLPPPTANERAFKKPIAEVMNESTVELFLPEVGS